MTRQPDFSPETSSSTGHPTPSRSLSPTSITGHRPSRHASPSPFRNLSKSSKSTSQPLRSNLDERPLKENSQYLPDEVDTFEMQTITDTPAGGHNVPLLADKDNDRNHGSGGRPALISRGSHLHTQAPKYPQPEDQTRRKYIYASFFLLLSLISFVVQTETAVYIQHELHWNKAYCMLWLTHGSWSLLWPAQLLILRLQNRKQSWSAFWRRHKALLTSTAQMVQHQNLYLSSSKLSRSPWPYMIKTTAFVTTFLTFAGASWYIAVDWTSPSDLTAIYNCSAFFAYVFSIYILHDKVRFDKVFSVLLAVAGVLVVAYGDSDNELTSQPKTPGHSGGSTNPNPDKPPGNRLIGNLIIGVGSVLYGLYEVLYKRYACPPEGASPNRGMIFANTFGSMIGLFTLTVLWIPLPILHFTGLEKFELPRGQAAYLLAVSTLSNAVFSGSFLVLMSLTSPVLSSVAALLTIFLVALTDWFLTGLPPSWAAMGGGTLIIVAFLLLSWATYREMQEEARKREMNDANKVLSDDEDDDDDDDSPFDRTGEREGLVQGDELDIENTRTRSARSNSAVIIRGDEDDWDDDRDDDDDDKTDLSTREAKMRRHRNS